MKSNKWLGSILFFGLVSATAGFSSARDSLLDPFQRVLNMMKNILEDNCRFQRDHTLEYFEKMEKAQNPRMTLVSCADSRVHTSNFDLSPFRDVFFVRNIGNQLEPCLGSIEYGLRHLHTPLLLILGHSKCGAVEAATKGTEGLEESIQRELEPMRLTHHTPNPTPEQIAENVRDNVHHQVNKACQIYQDLIHHEKLWVVGAVYDFTPTGKGKLTVLQVNDQTDLSLIAHFLEEVDRLGQYEEEEPAKSWRPPL